MTIRTGKFSLALRAHSVLVVEWVVLASAVVGLGLGVTAQLVLALPMVALTWWAQRGMRVRHELGPATTDLALATHRRMSLEDAP